MADLRSYIIGLSAGGDNLSAPSNDVQFVGSFGFFFDGSAWDRIRGDATDGLLVNLGGNNDVTVTGAVTADTELPAAAALADNASNPTAPAVGAFLMLWDSATWDRAPGTAVDGQLVNLGSNNDVTVTGTVTVDTELPNAAALADATSNPTVPGVGAFALGFNGTTWDRIRTANAGRLQVDVITGGGSDTPTNPANHYVTSSALAAGSAANLTTGDLGAKKLSQVEVWASVPYKVAIHTVEDGTASTDPIAIGGAPAHVGWTWKVPHRNYAAVTSNAGVDGFRAVVTNLDDQNAADVFATFHVED